MLSLYPTITLIVIFNLILLQIHQTVYMSKKVNITSSYLLECTLVPNDKKKHTLTISIIYVGNIICLLKQINYLLIILFNLLIYF